MKRTDLCRGFTLAELLVVIAVLAIISGGVVGLMMGLTSKSGITMNYATQKQLANQFNTYCRAHDGMMPDGFDSLMRDDYSAVSSTFSANFVTDETTGQILLESRATMPRGFIYTGYDTDQDGYADDDATMQGTTFMACGSGMQSLTVAQLRESDVEALNQLGITYVYDIDHSEDADTNSDVTYVKRELQAGDPVMALDPTNTQSTYQTINASSDLQNLYLVFGLGPNCSILGDRKGGLQEVPVCPTIVTGTTDKPKARSDYYNYYLVVVKIPYDSRDTPCFAAILDSQGWNTISGSQWYTRFPE